MNRRIVLVDIGQGMTLRGVLPSVALFAAYSARVTARGGQGPYTYTIVAGAAALEAAGIYLDGATGEVLSSGVTLGGTFPLTIRATSITGAYVERSFVIVVIAEPLALSGTYPDAVVGVAYSADLQISGGDGNYSNPRVVSGSLPPGLALSIVDSFLRLSGTSTGAMPRTAVVVAVDSAGGTATSLQLIKATDQLPAQYDDWRYLQTLLSDNTDFSAPTFDDSAWLVGTAPFGDLTGNPGPGANAHAFDARFSPTIATLTSINARLWLRRVVTIDSVPEFGYKLLGYFDNSYTLYVNGVPASAGSTATNAGTVAILRPQFFTTGVNVIAMRCDDTGGVAYFDFLLQPTTEHDITVSLLHFDGIAGSTTVVDETGVSWTTAGNAKISSSQSKFGGTSLELDGTGDYVSRVQALAGTEDFTIEARVYNRASVGTYKCIASQRSTSILTGRLIFLVTDTGKLNIFLGDSTNLNLESATNVPFGAFAHVAVTRASNVFRLFIDGVLSATSGTVTTPLENGPFYIGRDPYPTSGGRDWNGFIDEFRITKGVARYTSTFTPPTAPFSL